MIRWTASDIPLKLEGTNGDLKEMTPTEENYIAYQAGIHLKNTGGSSVGDIHLTSGTDIGSFVDTFYNEADNTHPASAITSGTTTTTLKQVNGPASYNHSNYSRPIGYSSSGNIGLHEFTDSDMDTLTDRINSRIATSDYPVSSILDLVHRLVTMAHISPEHLLTLLTVT